MTVMNWAVLSPEQAETLAAMVPGVDAFFSVIDRDDIDNEVDEDWRPMRGKIVIPQEVIDIGQISRFSLPLNGRLHEVVIGDNLRLSIVAATGQWLTMVADSAILFNDAGPRP